jgi:hypothetical protein
MPAPTPLGSGSKPTRLGLSTGMPLAMAWERCTVTQASSCRCYSSFSSRGSHPMAVG